MNAEILAVGTELLLGDIVNTNAQYLAQELARIGIGVLHQTVVGDNTERLTDAIRLALSRSDILITTGGLGPTGDDLTRETVASALGLELELNEEGLKKIEAFFAKTGRVMTENNKKQVMLPHGCIILNNEWGTAPGCIIEKDGKTVIMLPGPPREMRPIFETGAKPYLAKFQSCVIESVNLHVFGVPESTAEHLLTDLMQCENPTLAPYAKEGEVLLRVTARAGTSGEAIDMCTPVVEEIRRRLGDSVYGENLNGEGIDNLQQAVVTKLHEKGLKIASAESCTGGLIAKRLTEVPGCSDVFDCGIVSYANRIKHSLLGVNEETLAKYGAVSMQTAAQMAQGVRITAGADIGVSTTGIAGPGGGTSEKPVGLVFIGVSDGKTTFVKRCVFGHGDGDEREFIRYLASSNALDMVRRLINGLPQTDNNDKNALTVLSCENI